MKLDNIIDAIGVEPYYREDAGVIYNADCLDILPKMPEKCVDLVVTDPPYGIDANKMTLGSGKHQFHRGDNWDSNKITNEHFERIFHVAKFVAICGGNYYTDILPPNNNWLIWHKLNDGLSFSEAEMIWTNYSPNIRVYSKYVAGRVKSHPTEKPVELMSWCIKLNSDSPLILDPFLGSGTTAVAAKQLGRKYIGIEIEEKYCKIAVQRLAQEILI